MCVRVVDLRVKLHLSSASGSLHVFSKVLGKIIAEPYVDLAMGEIIRWTIASEDRFQF